MSTPPNAAFGPHRGWRSALMAFCVVSVLGATFMFGGSALRAQSASEEGASANHLVEIRDGVLERFEVVVLSDGLLLEPRDERTDIRGIEVRADGLAIDGEKVSVDELQSRVGDEAAALILGLSEVSEDQLTALFDGVGFDLGDQVAEATMEAEVESDDHEESYRDRRRDRYAHKKDAQVSIGSSITVEEDEVADEVVVIGGSLEIRGQVLGDAVAIGGPVVVSGEVTGSVASVGSSVELESGARVLGDAVSVGGSIEREEDTTIMGEIVEVPFGPNFSFRMWPHFSLFDTDTSDRDIDDFWRVSPRKAAMKIILKLFGVVVLALLACLALLLARKPIERIERRVAAEPWKSGLVGLVSQILFLPLLILVIVVLCISIIGIPLLLLVPFLLLAAVVIAFLGYSAVAYRLGQVLEGRFNWSLDNPYLVIAIGVVAIQVWAIIGSVFDLGWGPLWFIAVMFLLFGLLVCYVAWTVGTGAALLTRFGTAEGWGGEAQVALPPAAEESEAEEPEPSD